MPANGADVRELLLQALDEWATHARSCSLETCAHCDVLFNSVLLAHGVYGSSQRGPLMTAEAARLLTAASYRAHYRAQQMRTLAVSHQGEWKDCRHADCMSDRIMAAALNREPAGFVRKLVSIDVGERAMEGL
jgi:hypothetical protein